MIHDPLRPIVDHCLRGCWERRASARLFARFAPRTHVLHSSSAKKPKKGTPSRKDAKDGRRRRRTRAAGYRKRRSTGRGTPRLVRRTRRHGTGLRSTGNRTQAGRLHHKREQTGLKGRKCSAQGNALGERQPWKMRPEGPRQRPPCRPRRPTQGVRPTCRQRTRHRFSPIATDFEFHPEAAPNPAQLSSLTPPRITHEGRTRSRIRNRW